MKRFLTLLAAGLFLIGADKPLVIEAGQTKQLPAATSLQLSAPTTANATVNMPHGTAPTSPTNGDCWTTTGGLFCRINGATVGPYAATPAGAALTKTDDTNVTLTLGGSPTTSLVNAASITAGWTGQLGVTRGGTGLASLAQGDILYGSAANTLSALAKSTTASRYLSNGGTSNNPSWAQVDLSNGVTGRLPYANITQLAGLSVHGVTGASTADMAAITGTADQILRVNGAGTALAFGSIDLSKSAAVGTSRLALANLAQGSALSVLGVTGNATADNASIAAGSDNQVLRRSGTALGFGAVNLASSNAVSGTLPIANGGTGVAAFASARVYNNAAISAANGIETALTFNSERWDSDTMHSTVTNTSRLTATTAGLYQIGGTASFAASGAGTYRVVTIRLGGTTWIGFQGMPPVGGGAGATTVTVSTQYSLAAGDYVEMTVIQDTGGALNINAGGNYSPEFFMTRLGPQP